MAEEKLGRAVLELSTDKTQLDAGLNDVEARTKTLKESFSDVGKGLEKFGKSTTDLGKKLTVGLSAPIGAVIGGLAALAIESASTADQLLTDAKAAGLSTDAYQELTFALAQVANVSDAQVKDAFGNLTQVIGDAADGSKTAIEALTKLGYTEEEIASGTIDTEEAFRRFTLAMQAAKTPAEAVALAGDLVGSKVGKALAGALRDSGDQVDELRQQFRDLGLGMSGESLEAAAEFADQLDVLKMEAASMGREIGLAVVPIIKDTLIPFIRQTAIPVARDFAQAIGGVLKWFSELPQPVQSTALVITGLAAALGPVLVAVGSLASALGGLMPILGTVGTAIGALGAGPLALIVGAIGAVVLAWRNWDTIVEIAQNVYQGVKTWISDKLAAVFDAVKSKVDAVTGFFRGMYDAVVGHSIVPDMVDGVGREMDRLPEVMGNPTKAATKLTLDEFKALQAATQAVAKNFVEQLADVKRETASLTDEQRKNIRAGLELGKSVKEIADVVGVSEQAVARYKEQIQQATRAAEEKKRATDAWLASIDSVTRSTVSLRSYLTEFKTAVDDSAESIRNITAGLNENGTIITTNALETARLRAEAEQWAITNGAVLAPSIQQTTSLLEDATIATQGWGGAIKQAFTDAIGDFTSFANAGRSIFEKMMGKGGSGGILGGIIGGFFKGGGAGALSSLVSSGLSIATGFMSQGLNMMADIAWKGLKKIGGFFKQMFGGPSADELAGREIVQKFEDNILSMMTEQQRLETGHERWAQIVVVLRDKYIEMGLTEQEALRDAERLWASSKSGAAESQRVVEEITRKMQGFGQSVQAAFNQFPREITIPVNFEVGDLPDVHPMAAGGIGRVHEPTLFLAGERGPEDFAFSGANRSFEDLGGFGGDVSALRQAFREEFGAMRRELSTSLRDAMAGAV